MEDPCVVMNVELKVVPQPTLLHPVCKCALTNPPPPLNYALYDVILFVGGA
jgi:hypothetical protein